MENKYPFTKSVSSFITFLIVLGMIFGVGFGIYLFSINVPAFGGKFGAIGFILISVIAAVFAMVGVEAMLALVRIEENTRHLSDLNTPNHSPLPIKSKNQPEARNQNKEEIDKA